MLCFPTQIKVGTLYVKDHQVLRLEHRLGLMEILKNLTVADPGVGAGVGARPPSKKIIKNEDLFLYNFVVKNVFLSIFIYKIALQNRKYGFRSHLSIF